MTGQTELPAAAKPKRQTKFDFAEREKIRSAILAYAKENKIGAPNLQLRIADATKRTVDQIPLKTLQRFLKDHGRTNDGFLVPLAEFVSAAGAMTPHDALAHDLGEFFSHGETGRSADIVPERFAGHYEVWAGPTKFHNIKVWTSATKILNPDVHYGRFRVSGSGRGLKVHEEETGPGSNGTAGVFRPAANEGMMLFFDPLVFVLLKNALTRLPRVYWLRERDEGRLTGHAMHGIPREPGEDYPPYTELQNFDLRPLAQAAP